MSIFGKERPASGLGGGDSSFKSVLIKLATDKAYLHAATERPGTLLKDFPELTIQELDALRDAAVLSGADVSKIDPLHGAIAQARPGSGEALGGDGCCCCCCCGTTGTSQ